MREKDESHDASYNSCLLTAHTVITTPIIPRATASFDLTKGIFVVARKNYSTAKQQVAEDRLHRSRVDLTFIQHDGDIICNRDGISGSGSDRVDGVGEELIGWFIHMRKAPRKTRGKVSLEEYKSSIKQRILQLTTYLMSLQQTPWQG